MFTLDRDYEEIDLNSLLNGFNRVRWNIHLLFFEIEEHN